MKVKYFALALLGWSLALQSLIADDNFDFRVESKLNYRNSESNRYAVSFPFPSSFLPQGESLAFLETVESGEHLELSNINVSGIWRMSDQVSAQFALDIGDLYDRNPTSSDQKIDLDKILLRYGKRPSALRPHSDNTFFGQIGKFEKFERQNERRTESYGLVSTTFNRFEDAGIELGFDLGWGFYSRASWTTGNPVFIRDPNALAGENGTNQRRVPPENPDPKLKSGVVLLYDAEVEEFQLDDDSEKGLGLGYKWQGRAPNHIANFLVFSYERKLQEERELHGTFYGADLDLFDLGDVPGAGGIRLPAEGIDKKESGFNLWYNVGSFALFTQYVDQEMASMERSGFEVELSYVFGTKYNITPVIRYSSLENDFVGSPLYPAPSVWWDWEKIDYGLNIDLTKDLRLIIEYADNQFVRNGKKEDNNETLVTLRWKPSID